jgi:dienelactone hydrolase
VHLLQQLIAALREHCGWAADRIFLLGYGQGGTCALSLALSLARSTRRGGSSSSSGSSSGGGTGIGSSSSGGSTRQPAGAVALGGVISICGALLDEEEAQLTADLNKQSSATQNSTRNGSSSGSCSGATPVLLLCGERDAEVPPARMQRTAAVCARALDSSMSSSNAGTTTAAAADAATAATGVEVVVLPNRGQGMLSGASEVRPVMAFLARHLARRLVALEKAADVVELSTSASAGGAFVTQM